LPDGALAPPEGVAADSLPPLAVSSLFAVSLEVPPADSPLLSEAPLSLPPLDAASSLEPDSSPEELEEPSLDLPVEVVDEVEVVCTAAFSALVSVGGVMSGVLLGTESLTLLPPPQAVRPTEHSSRTLAAIAAREEGRREGRAGGSGGERCARTSFTRAGWVLISGPQALN
jgi:hypothetical protein